MFKAVDVSSPKKMTIAIGASISQPGFPMPSSIGTRVRPAAGAVMNIGAHFVIIRTATSERPHEISYSNSRQHHSNVLGSCGCFGAKQRAEIRCEQRNRGLRVGPRRASSQLLSSTDWLQKGVFRSGLFP